MAVRALLCVAVFAVTCAVANGSDLSDYYHHMTLPANGGWASELHDLQEIKLPGGRSLRLILVAGSVLDFVGPSPAAGSGRRVWPVDGMIMCTNIDLNFDANNPMIQESFRDKLSTGVKRAIRNAFKEQKELADYRDALVVRCPAGFSPRAVGFVVTDKEKGGTWNNCEWQTTVLGLDAIGKRIENALDAFQPAGPKSVATLLIGASQVDFTPPGADPFIKDGEKRTELLQRMQKSMKGILKGVKDHVTKPGASPRLDEFGIVVYTRDVSKLVSKEERESIIRGTDRGLDRFGTVKTALMSTFSEGAEAIRGELKK